VPDVGEKAMKFVQPEKIRLKGHPELTEKWVEDQLVANPALLGLGELTVRDRQRNQPSAGRLDLLLQDEDNRRYEVEIQLGATDETHIIRTLEYWDIERKRYPQYEHCAVVVAEDVTSRFLNVISLFNGSIPIIAIQMTGLRMGDGVGLLFTTVLGEMERGLVDEDEERTEAADRSYWETRGSKLTVRLADDVLKFVQAVEPKMQLNFTKNYVGLARDGVADNFLILGPKKTHLHLALRLDKTDEIDAAIESSGLDALPYGRRHGRYRLRLTEADLTERAAAVRQLVERAWREWAGQ
jgi:hypothetical protein